MVVHRIRPQTMAKIARNAQPNMIRLNRLRGLAQALTMDELRSILKLYTGVETLAGISPTRKRATEWLISNYPRALVNEVRDKCLTALSDEEQREKKLKLFATYGRDYLKGPTL